MLVGGVWADVGRIATSVFVMLVIAFRIALSLWAEDQGDDAGRPRRRSTPAARTQAWARASKVLVRVGAVAVVGGLVAFGVLATMVSSDWGCRHTAAVAAVLVTVVTAMVVTVACLVTACIGLRRHRAAQRRAVARVAISVATAATVTVWSVVLVAQTHC